MSLSGALTGATRRPPTAICRSQSFEIDSLAAALITTS